ncbi:MAG: DinB family protein [Acidobacteria bacterium]|nr:DinB family protein [Acidobacteriota bacterium]MBI3421452.1 DinB family protein [Acidobacteriota bacterium]
MHNLLEEFRQTITDSHYRLVQISEDDSAVKPASDKWSPKEIIGHLIDSASNNHQRFVRGQFYDDLELPGYEQERWVVVQGYQQTAWAELLLFWKCYNEHLARVTALMPAENLARTVRIGGGEPVTLGFLVEDYVRHLQMHLRQILG